MRPCSMHNLYCSLIKKSFIKACNNYSFIIIKIILSREFFTVSNWIRH